MSLLLHPYFNNPPLDSKSPSGDTVGIYSFGNFSLEKTRNRKSKIQKNANEKAKKTVFS